MLLLSLIVLASAFGVLYAGPNGGHRRGHVNRMQQRKAAAQLSAQQAKRSDSDPLAQIKNATYAAGEDTRRDHNLQARLEQMRLAEQRSLIHTLLV